jgi:hypothetical protein
MGALHFMQNQLLESLYSMKILSPLASQMRQF